MKSTGNKKDGTGLWNKNSSTEGINTSGFSGLPGGYRFLYGSFNNLGDYGYWWSATLTNAGTPRYRGLFYDSSGFNDNSNYFPQTGYGCRCVKD